MSLKNVDLFPVILLVAVVTIIGIGALAVKTNTDNANTFKEACTEREGKPVYNGRYWECLK